MFIVLIIEVLFEYLDLILEVLVVIFIFFILFILDIEDFMFFIRFCWFLVFGFELYEVVKVKNSVVVKMKKFFFISMFFYKNV